MATKQNTVCKVQQNQLLAALPQADSDLWQDAMELVELSLHQVISAPGKTPEYVYFPITAMVSLMYLTQEGSSVEVGLVGNDGVVGVSLFLGDDVLPSEAVVQSAGKAYRLSAHFVKSEVARSGAILKIMLRYAQAMLGQVAQTAVCNRYHSVDQQLARRLLLGLDRSPSEELNMTHELAANLLGVRREGISVAANKLQVAGMIRYHRGHIVVLDRPLLEKHSCECYAASKKEYRRLMPISMPMALAA